MADLKLYVGQRGLYIAWSSNFCLYLEDHLVKKFMLGILVECDPVVHLQIYRLM